MPLIGVLDVTGSYFTQEHQAGIGVVTVQVGWADAEPAANSFSTSYIQGIQAEIASARAAGLEVVLDPGLQYPPQWVFALDSGTRFVDQYGDVFTGTPPSGDDVANAVTDLNVRNAEGAYLTWLGSQISASQLVAVREGGGPLGELRYPDPTYNGHTDAFWAYDTTTQAGSPVPGWTPGTGTTTQAQEFLDAYNSALVGYGVWLNSQLATDFPTQILLMLPGWGERPGGEAQEVAGLLTSDMDEFNEGLDWSDLFTGLPDPAVSVAYTTYLDAPSVKATPALEDPADYLASLVAGTSLGLGGENTGNGTLATLAVCAQRALALHLLIFQWMGESQLVAADSGRSPGTPTMADLGASFRNPTVTSVSLPRAVDGQPYSASLTAFGGSPTYTWSVTSGALPPGIALNGSAGSLTGTPGATGLWRVTVRVTDLAGHSASSPISLVVTALDPPSALPPPFVGMAATPDGGGYWLADASGGVQAFGDAAYFGSMASVPLNQSIVRIVATADGGGYWLVASDGGIFAIGDAPFLGSMGGHLLNAPVVDIAPTPDGGGYWLVASDGGIFAFGDAAFHGSMGGQPLNRPVVGMAEDPGTGGYWEVASDGGVFAFGAPFFGSTGNLALASPIDGMSVAAPALGYWFVASDGGIFAFGNAHFGGSVVGIATDPVVGMAADAETGGYWEISSGGGVYAIDAPFFGAG